MQAGIRAILDNTPSEYRLWALRQRKSFLKLGAEINRDIYNLYESVGQSIEHDLILFGALHDEEKAWEFITKDLELHRKELEKELAERITKYTSDGAKIGVDLNRRITMGLLEEAGVPENLLIAKSNRIFRAHHEAIKAAHTMKINGLNLSDRIWGVSQKTGDVLGDIISEGMSAGLNSEHIGQAIGQYVKQGKRGLAELIPTADKMGVPMNIEFNATRLAQTQMSMAYGMAVDKSAYEMPGAIGIGYRLSNTHPIYDICDILCGVDDYGLGEGVYPFDAIPEYPFHPFCRCVKYVAMEDPDKIVDRLTDWVNDPSSQPDVQAWVEGKRNEMTTYAPRDLMQRNGHIDTDTPSKNVGKSTKNGYNRNKKQLKIPQFSSTLEIKQKVKSGEISLNVNHEHYEKHFKGTKQYEAYYKSRLKRGWGQQGRLTISEEEAQALVYKHHGTGIVLATGKGNPRKEECVNFNKKIGYYVFNNSEHPTTKGKIVYSKTGAHIIPLRGEKFD